MLACEADSKGRLGFEDKDYPQAQWLKQAFYAANQVDVKAFIAQGLAGKDIGEALRKKRLEAIQQLTRSEAQHK